MSKIDALSLADAQPVHKQALTTEVGVTGLSQAGGEVTEWPLRQLRSRRRRMDAFTEMSRYDDIVKATLRASTLLCRGASWRVEPASEDSVDLRNAEFLEENQQDMSHSWNDFVSEALTMLAFGFSYAEIVMKRRNGERRRPGESSRFTDGRLGIRKLSFRAQETIQRWQFDDSGGIRAALQTDPERFREIAIPIEKSLLFRTESTKNNPEGQSVLEGSFISWFIKKKIQQYEAIRVERDATGIPVAKVPSEMLHTDASATDKALLTKIQRIVRDIRFNEQSGIVWPLAYDEEGNEIYKLELLTAPGDRPSTRIGPIIDRLNRGIAMSTLADVILVGHEGKGSYALASSKTNLFSVALGAYLDIIEEALNRHLVPRLFRWNGIRADNLPQFRHGDIETVPLDEVGDYIQKLSQAGAPLFPDVDLENELRRIAGLPQRPEMEPM